MPVAPAKRSAVAKQARPQPSATGLSAAERAKYQRKLVTASLAQEKKGVLAVKAEVERERGSVKLLSAADEKLQLIAEESRQRDRLKPFAAFVRSLEKSAPSQLQALKSSVTGEKLLAVTRELARRTHTAAVARAGRENSRLETVKRGFAAQLGGRTAAELKAEKSALSAKLDSLRALPPSPSRDGAMRVLYAKRSAVSALLPVPFDRRKMHAYADSLKPRTLKALRSERADVAARRDGMTRGAVRGSRAQLREAEVMLAILDAAIAKKAAGARRPAPVKPVAPVRPVDSTRNPGNVVFEGPGMFIENPARYPASAHAAKLKAAGVTWVAFQAHNPRPVFEADGQAFVDQWRAAGFKVGVWGVSYGDAAADGVTAAQQTKRYGADFYIADCEGSFQAGEGDPARNRQFVDAFQAEATRLGIGDVPRALSSMGRVAIDHQPWIQNGWDAMPQAYWNDHAVYEPTACAKFYEDWGWPKERIHLTIGTYQPTGDGTPKTVADYVEPLKRTGLKGFSYYLPENYLDDAAYRQLADGIANGMNG